MSSKATRKRNSPPQQQQSDSLNSSVMQSRQNSPNFFEQERQQRQLRLERYAVENLEATLTRTNAPSPIIAECRDRVYDSESRLFADEHASRVQIMLLESTAIAAAWQSKLDLTTTHAYATSHYKLQRAMKEMKAVVEASRDAAKEEGVRKISMTLQQETSRRQALELVVADYEQRISAMAQKEEATNRDLRAKIDDLERKIRGDRHMHSSGVAEVKVAANRAMAERAIAQSEAKEAAERADVAAQKLQAALADNELLVAASAAQRLCDLEAAEAEVRVQLEESLLEQFTSLSDCMQLLVENEVVATRREETAYRDWSDAVRRSLGKCAEIVRLYRPGLSPRQERLLLASAAVHADANLSEQREERQLQLLPPLPSTRPNRPDALHWIQQHIAAPISDKIRRDDSEIAELRDTVVALAKQATEHEDLLRAVAEGASNTVASLVQRCNTAEVSLRHAKEYAARREKARQAQFKAAMEALYEDASDRLPNAVAFKMIFDEEEISRCGILLAEQDDFVGHCLETKMRVILAAVFAGARCFSSSASSAGGAGGGLFLQVESSAQCDPHSNNLVSDFAAQVTAEQIILEHVCDSPDLGLAVFNPMIENFGDEVMSEFGGDDGLESHLLTPDVSAGHYGGGGYPRGATRSRAAAAVAAAQRKYQQHQQLQSTTSPRRGSVGVSSNDNLNLTATPDRQTQQQQQQQQNDAKRNELRVNMSGAAAAIENSSNAFENFSAAGSPSTNMSSPFDDHHQQQQSRGMQPTSSTSAVAPQRMSASQRHQEYMHQKQLEFEREQEEQRNSVAALREALHVAVTRAEEAERRVAVMVQAQLQRVRRVGGTAFMPLSTSSAAAVGAAGLSSSSGSNHHHHQQHHQAAGVGRITLSPGASTAHIPEALMSSTSVVSILMTPRRGGDAADHSNNYSVNNKSDALVNWQQHTRSFSNSAHQHQQHDNENSTNNNPPPTPVTAGTLTGLVTPVLQPQSLRMMSEEQQQLAEDERDVWAREFERRLIQVQREKVELKRKLDQALAQAAMAEDRRVAAIDRKLALFADVDAIQRRCTEAERRVYELETGIVVPRRAGNTPTLSMHGSTTSGASRSMSPGISTTSFDALGLSGGLPNTSFVNSLQTNSLQAQNSASFSSQQQQHHFHQHHHRDQTATGTTAGLSRRSSVSFAQQQQQERLQQTPGGTSTEIQTDGGGAGSPFFGALSSVGGDSKSPPMSRSPSGRFGGAATTGGAGSRADTKPGSGGGTALAHSRRGGGGASRHSGGGQQGAGSMGGSMHHFGSLVGSVPFSLTTIGGGRRSEAKLRKLQEQALLKKKNHHHRSGGAPPLSSQASSGQQQRRGGSSSPSRTPPTPGFGGGGGSSPNAAVAHVQTTELGSMKQLTGVGFQKI